MRPVRAERGDPPRPASGARGQARNARARRHAGEGPGRRRGGPATGGDGGHRLVTLDRELLLGVAQAEREALGRTIQYTDPSAWDQNSRLDGWRNRDVVAHLAASEAVAASALGWVPGPEVQEFISSGTAALACD